MKGKEDPNKDPECSSYAHIRADCGVCITLMFQTVLETCISLGSRLDKSCHSSHMRML